jgi:hypothetical protein
MLIQSETVSSYEIGYGKPPKHMRFRKGQSGNPKGRTKGTPDVSAALLRALNERVTVTESGERKRISKFEAVLKQLVNKAAGGDARATKLVIDLVDDIAELVASPPVLQLVISERDARL